jgi:hypothetical protein
MSSKSVEKEKNQELILCGHCGKFVSKRQYQYHQKKVSSQRIEEENLEFERRRKISGSLNLGMDEHQENNSVNVDLPEIAPFSPVVVKTKSNGEGSLSMNLFVLGIVSRNAQES